MCNERTFTVSRQGRVFLTCGGYWRLIKISASAAAAALHRSRQMFCTLWKKPGCVCSCPALFLFSAGAKPILLYCFETPGRFLVSISPTIPANNVGSCSQKTLQHNLYKSCNASAVQDMRRLIILLYSPSSKYIQIAIPVGALFGLHCLLLGGPRAMYMSDPLNV